MTRRQLNKKLGPGNFHRIARAAGVNPAHVSRVLRGKRGASFTVADKIATAAGVTMDQLRTHIKDQVPA